VSAWPRGARRALGAAANFELLAVGFALGFVGGWCAHLVVQLWGR